LDIYGLTIQQAKDIYRRDYWVPMNLEGRPYGPALCLFDCAVNQGISRARAILNRVATSSEPFIIAFQAERALHYASLSTFQTFGRGWMRRLLRVTVEANK
jgi:lysozyme family protein